MTMNYFAAPGLKKVELFNPNYIELILKAHEAAYMVWKVTPDELADEERIRPKVQARQFVMWYLYKTTHLGTIEIGKRYKRDHSTVIHARRVVQSALDGFNPQFKKKIEQALTILNN